MNNSSKEMTTDTDKVQRRSQEFVSDNWDSEKDYQLGSEVEVEEEDA